MSQSFFKINAGDDLLSQRVAPQVPSAQEGLTSVFGMGTGVTPPLWSPTRLLRIESIFRFLFSKAYKRAKKIRVLQKFHRGCRRFVSYLNIVGQASRPISTSKLKALLPVHTWPINHVIYMGSLVRINRRGYLISGGAWLLDAFRAYPFPT